MDGLDGDRSMAVGASHCGLGIGQSSYDCSLRRTEDGLPPQHNIKAMSPSSWFGAIYLGIWTTYFPYCTGSKK